MASYVCSCRTLYTFMRCQYELKLVCLEYVDLEVKSWVSSDPSYKMMTTRASQCEFPSVLCLTRMIGLGFFLLWRGKFC